MSFGRQEQNVENGYVDSYSHNLELGKSQPAVLESQLLYSQYQIPFSSYGFAQEWVGDSKGSNKDSFHQVQQKLNRKPKRQKQLSKQDIQQFQKRQENLMQMIYNIKVTPLEVVKKFAEHSGNLIPQIFASKVNEQNLEKICRQRIEKLIRNRQSIKRNWVKGDIILLAWAVIGYSKYKDINHYTQITTKDWEQISELIPGSTKQGCKQKWLGLMMSNIKKKPWSNEQSLHLNKLIKQQGGDWKKISDKLFDSNNDNNKVFRSVKRCRQHYNSYLRSNLKKSFWKQEQDVRLMTAVKLLHGRTKWNKIEEFLQGRTQNAIKNRYFYILQKELDKWQECNIKNQDKCFDNNPIIVEQGQKCQQPNRIQNAKNRKLEKQKRIKQTEANFDEKDKDQEDGYIQEQVQRETIKRMDAQEFPLYQQQLSTTNNISTGQSPYKIKKALINRKIISKSKDGQDQRISPHSDRRIKRRKLQKLLYAQRNQQAQIQTQLNMDRQYPTQFQLLLQYLEDKEFCFTIDEYHRLQTYADSISGTKNRKKGPKVFKRKKKKVVQQKNSGQYRLEQYSNSDSDQNANKYRPNIQHEQDQSQSEC